MFRLYQTIRILLITTLTGAALGTSLAQSEPPPVVHPPQPPRRVAVEGKLPTDSAAQSRAGFRLREELPISIRPIRSISSQSHDTGSIFEAILDQNIEVDDRVVLARGTRVFGEVVEVLKGGRFKGRAELTVTLREIEIDGVNYPLGTNPITVVAGANKAKDTKKVGIAASLGAIIGGIAGGKKGAAIGASIGGGAQTSRVLTSRGKAATIEKERLLTFRLEKELVFGG